MLVRSKRAGRRARKMLVDLLQRLGLRINWEKSSLRLSQDFVFLGLQWSSRSASVSIPSDKLQEFRALAVSMASDRVIPARSLMSFLGKANFLAYGHATIRRLVRVLQRDLLSWYHSPADLFKPVRLSSISVQRLGELAGLEQDPVPLVFPHPEVIVSTDATPQKWALYFQGLGLPRMIQGD